MPNLSDLNKTKQNKNGNISQHSVISFSKERCKDKSKNLIYAATPFQEEKCTFKEISKQRYSWETGKSRHH